MSKQITFKYKFPEDYNPIYVNGAQGGVNSKGEIVANFFFERIALPNKQVHELSEVGTLGQIIRTDPENLNESLVRYVENGIVMNLNTAKEIYQWLGNNIALAEKILKHE